jgi:hypothetical protein
MYRHLLSVLVLAALLSGQWLHTGILVHFITQQDIIAKTLCIKKDEVQNTCKGTCHLRKQMKETEKHQEELPQLPKEELTIVFCSTVSSIVFDSESEQTKQHAVIPHMCPRGSVTDLLRPPQLV